MRVAGLNFPLTIWTVQRDPAMELDPVIAALSGELMERL